MSICLCYKSAAAAACVHWQGPDRMPLSELHEQPLGKHCLPAQRDSPLSGLVFSTKGAGREQFPHKQSLPHWRLSTVQKRRNYHKYAFFEINISQSHHRERGLCVFMHHLILLHCTSRGGGLLLITSGVNWALILSLFWKRGILSESAKRHYILRRWAPVGRKEPCIGKWQRTRYGASSVRFTFLFMFSLKLV